MFVYFNAQYKSMNNNLRTLSRMQNFFLIDECPKYLIIRWYYPLYSTSGLVNPCNRVSRKVGVSSSRKMSSWLIGQVAEGGFNVLGQNWSQGCHFWSYAVIVRLYYIQGEHCGVLHGGHFCWRVDDIKEFSEDLLYHIPQQSFIGIMFSLLFLKRHEYRTHQLSAYVDWGQMDNLAWSCLWFLPSVELMEITAREKNSEGTKRDKEKFIKLCNLGLLKKE